MKAFLMKVPRPTTIGWIWIAAVGSAALAMYAGQRYLGAREAALSEAARAGMAGREVVVASHALRAGIVLAASDLAVREVPDRYLPSGSLSASEAGALIGRRVRVARHAGEVLQRPDIEQPSQEALSDRVAPGMRAVALAVDDLGAVSGLLQPGDEVDLYFMPTGSEGDARIGLLLSRVVVLATGPRTVSSTSAGAPARVGDSFTAITVQLSPDDAERLALAQRAGQVLPVLRKPGDEPTTFAGVRSARSLLRSARLPVQHRREESLANRSPLSLEVIVGGQGNAIAGRDALPVEGNESEKTGGR